MAVTPAGNAGLEKIPARQSPNDPAIAVPILERKRVGRPLPEDRKETSPTRKPGFNWA